MRGAPKNRLLREVSGWSLVAVGIAGCVLPVLPGIPFILAGLAFLAQDYEWAQRAIEKIKRSWERAKESVLKR